MDITGKAEAFSVFISYADEDESSLRRLDQHLSSLRNDGMITTWYRQKSYAGKDWHQDVRAYLRSADIILLLVSPNFIASEYCHDFEVAQAMTRYERYGVFVIPIIIKPVFWRNELFGKLEKFPEKKDFIQRDEEDETFARVASSIQNIVENLRTDKTKIASSSPRQKTPQLSTKQETSLISFTRRRFLRTAGGGFAAGLVSGIVGSLVVPAVVQRLITSSSGVSIVFTHGDLPTGVDVKTLESQMAHYFNRDCNIVFGKDYGASISLFLTGKYTMFWASDFAYIVAYARNPKIKPILSRLNRGPDPLVYYSHILTRSRSNIKKVEDLSQKRFSFVDKYSTSGYLYPRYMIQAAGVSFESLNLQVTWPGTHTDSLRNLLDGAVDACAVSSEYYKSKDGKYMSEEYSKLLQSNQLQDKDIRSLIPNATYANPIPMGPIVVRQDISDSEIRDFKEAFYSIDKDTLGSNGTLGSLGISSFEPTEDGVYDPVRAVAYKMGIDLATY